MKRVASFLLAAVAFTGVGCGTPSLYDRLGGEPAIKLVVDDFVPAAAADPKVNFFRDGKYKDTDVAKLKMHLVNQIGQASGGPQKYTGRDMKSAHAGMKITEAEFNALAGHLVTSLKKFKVGQKEIDELVGAIAGMKGDIVGQ